MVETALRVEYVSAEATYTLRQRVLRPHLGPGELRLPGDDDGDAAHLAALDEADEVMGTVRVAPAECPWRPEQESGWQLRAMATAAHLRGQGIGSVLIRSALRHVYDHGGTLVWCNARVRAQDFYCRAGFTVTGPSWDVPMIGPHVGMTCELPR